jgi:hypothetical protein
MFRSITDLGNISLIDSASPCALRDGDTRKEAIHNDDPDHNEYLYLSGRRPLGMWFSPDWEYSHISGATGWSIIGTSDPLSMKALNSYELRPVDEITRSASVIREWDLVSDLAAYVGDSYDPDSVALLHQTAPGTITVSSYREDGHIGNLSFIIDGEGPYATGEGTFMRGVSILLEGDREMIEPRFALSMLDEWGFSSMKAA